MSLSSQIVLTAARVLGERAQGYAGRALRLAQRGAEQAAVRMQSEAPRFTALTEAGLRAAEVSCRALDRLLRQGLQSARGVYVDGAERLRITARADSFAALYGAQSATLPASRERIAKELEATWEIVVSTGRELADVAREVQRGLVRTRQRAAHGRTRASRRSKRATRHRSGAARPS
ncbi:MAG TPA: hypothetical protein VMD49_00380 [Steroidobacteraceae bacterium]|nr:hypothetical protein [Steroidobacteraceae bacterium]